MEDGGSQRRARSTFTESIGNVLQRSAPPEAITGISTASDTRRFNRLS